MLHVQLFTFLCFSRCFNFFLLIKITSNLKYLIFQLMICAQNKSQQEFSDEFLHYILNGAKTCKKFQHLFTNKYKTKLFK